MKTTSFLLLSLCLLSACHKPAPPAPAAPAPELQRFVLAVAPAPALTVLAAKQAGSAAQVVVHGRIGNIVKGYAAFTLMDTSLPYCGETNPEDKCKTPWDYCCEKAATRNTNALVVELQGADGKVLASPSLPELRLLDEVLVTGKLQIDADGNAVLIAAGYHRKARPEVPDYVRWPE